MTIPEIEAEIKHVTKGQDSLGERMERMEDDLQELRRQLGVERLPQTDAQPYIPPATRE